MQRPLRSLWYPWVDAAVVGQARTAVTVDRRAARGRVRQRNRRWVLSTRHAAKVSVSQKWLSVKDGS